jgi:hypothetical protein
MFDGTNGCYFKLVGTAMSVCTCNATSETAVASASWNGSTTTPTVTNCTTYEIYVNNRRVHFVISGVLVHTVDSVAAPWTATTTLPLYASNVNSGNTTDTIMKIRSMTIARLGQLETLPTYFHGTTAATTVLKYSAGNLHKITLNKPTGTLITLYDNTAASGSVIAVIATPAQANPVTLDYNIPFAIGLTIVTTGTWDYTIVYE